MTERRPTEPGDDALRRAYGAAIAGAPGPHLTEDDWVRLASDEVSSDERATFADHIAHCGACTTTWQVLAEVRAGAAAIDPGAPRPVPAASSWALGRWAGLAAAAVVVLAVATSWPRGDSTPQEPATPSVAPSTSAAAPSVEAVPPAAAPALRDWAALPEAPAVMLPASLALTVRGASTDRDTFLAAFGPAIAPYREGRYADAVAALEPVSRRFADVAEVWFYLGVSRLLAGDAAAAAPALQRASESDAVGAQAVWLRIVALERAGRADEATATLRATCAAAEVDAHRAACAALPPPR